MKEEHNLSLEWMEHIVPARDEVQMELVWTPQMEVACKETLQLLDNRNFRKEVMIILKSRSNQAARVSSKQSLNPFIPSEYFLCYYLLCFAT